MRTVLRGIAAGAAGTTVLNSVTYADMILRGRPASESPTDLISRIPDGYGLEMPGNKQQRSARTQGLAQSLGIVAGLGVGVVAAISESIGTRGSRIVGAIATGAAAMAAAELPLLIFRISDPRFWTAADWMTDVVPHLAYGATVQGVLNSNADRADFANSEDRGRRPKLMVRAFALGVATGGRSSSGLAALAGTASGQGLLAGRPAKYGALLAASAEFVADKLPRTPGRTQPAAAIVRLGAGTGAGWALAQRANAPRWRALGTAMIGGAATIAGTLAGAYWRGWASSRMPTWQAAVAEDVAVASLAVYAVR